MDDNKVIVVRHSFFGIGKDGVMGNVFKIVETGTLEKVKKEILNKSNDGTASKLSKKVDLSQYYIESIHMAPHGGKSKKIRENALKFNLFVLATI